MEWRFMTEWFEPDPIGVKVARSKAVIIHALDQLSAMRQYCRLEWAQEINYADFVSLTITIVE